MRTSILTCFFILFACSMSNIGAKPSAVKREGVEIILTGRKQRFTFSRIVRIERWGIVVIDRDLERTALYHVINTATLYDSTYVNAIKRHVSNLKVTVEKDSFILDFNEAILPKLEYTHPKKVVDYKYYTLNLCLDKVEHLETGFVYSLRPFQNLLHRITVSFGYPYSKDPSYYVWGLNYAIGLRIVKSEHYVLVTWVNYARKFLEVGSGSASVHSQKDTFALGVGTIMGSDEKTFYSVDIKYHFNNVEIEGTEQKLRLLVGINRKF
ncbi:hypothetical protein E3J38_07235 [candidate division TA06 bacterium]|uniref:Uncharacterized protein n=1 Tax=candidate division TA06 bacterium TaxID=2250710 RepID=A0A523XJG2_UNCT6|nr:MAG: hypothetical protein E3J38_07235 [candidate division TA06 bacterium]